MKYFMVAVLLGVASFAFGGGSEAQKQALAVIASPDLKEPLDSSFSVAKGNWTPADGILTAAEKPEDKHVAVLHHNVGLGTAQIDLDFRLDGSPSFLVGCDGKGHVGRVVVKPNGIDIAEDSVKPSHVIATLKMSVAPNEWHHLRVQWSTNEMTATVDNQSIHATHDFFASPKARTWLAVPKSKTEIKNLIIRGEKADAK